MNKKVKLSQKNKKKSIDKIRKNIDEIDAQILKLISFRRKEVLQITKYKKRSEIVDKKRITTMLKRLVLEGNNLKIESYFIENIWKAIIKSFIKLEKILMK